MGRFIKLEHSLGLTTLSPMAETFNTISHYWDMWDIMPVARIDEKGRVLLPKEIRSKLHIKPGDELIVGEYGEDTVIMRKVDLRALLDEVIEEARKVDLKALEEEIEQRSNERAKRNYSLG